MHTIHHTNGSSEDARRALHILMAGAEGGGPSARAAQHAQDEELAEFFRKVQEEVLEVAAERLAQREAQREASPRERHEVMLDDEEKEFAERAARRLEAVAGRLEQESRRPRVVDGETLARAQELRVAAFIVRDEAKVVALRDLPFPQGAQERDETGLRAS